MLATLFMYVFFSSCLVLFVLDTVGIDKLFMHGDLVLSCMFNITVVLGVVYGVVTFASVLSLIS